MSDNEHKSYRIDLVYASILGLTVIMTAWCGLQHELWSSMVTFELKDANTAHREFTTAELKERQAIIVDVISFTKYMDAAQNDDKKLGDLYKNSFSPELKQAFDVWMKTDPLNNPDAGTPFTMSEYQSKLDSTKATEFLQRANEKSQSASNMSTIASNYVFFTTIFASVSFLEGIGRVFPSKKMQLIFLIMGIVLFSVTTIILFTVLPIANIHPI